MLDHQPDIIGETLYNGIVSGNRDMISDALKEQTEASASEKVEPHGIRRVHDFARLTERKRRLEAMIKANNAELRNAETDVLEYLAENGIQSIKTTEGTVYHRMTMRARLNTGDLDAAHAVMRELEMGDLIKPNVNANSLSAWIRENDNVIPEGLKPHIDAYEDHRIGFKSAS